MPETKRKGLVPRLRFPEFRDAGPWEVKRLGEVFRFIPTNSLSRAFLTYDSGQVRNIHYGDIHTKFRSLFDIEKEEVPFINGGMTPEVFDQDSFCLPGDVIFADASEDIDDIGKAIEVINVGEEKIVSGLHTLHARQKEAAYLVGFPGYLFQSGAIKKQIQKESQGAKVLGISATRLAKIKIFTPIKEEQQKIADFLSSLDGLIELHAQRLEALKAHKKGLMQQLFPREGETTPRLRFPEFRDAGPWEERTIADISEKIAQGGTPKTSVAEYWNGEIPWITPAEMGDDAAHHYTKQTLRTISIEGLENCSAELLPANSVIISSRAPIGYVTINKVEMTTNQGCKGIVPKAEIYHEFLYFSLLVANRRLNDLGAGAGFKEISISTLKSFRIAVPDFPEQQKIADFLSSLDDLIRAQEQHIEALKAHKKGLQQQLFPQEVD